MKASNKLILKLKEFEGCKLKAYKCPAGVWTIGIGHTGKEVKSGMVITLQQAEDILKADLAKFEKAVERHYRGLNQNQFDSLVDMAFNCGEGAISGTLKSLINKKTSKDMVQKWWKTHYITSSGVKLKGLENRRAWEAENFYK